MSVAITNNTLTQILIRRGTDATRKQVVLAAGELGYTTDTQRLFIGDGVTLGGNIACNKFLGYATIQSLSTLAQIGDIAFDPVQNNLFVFTLSGFEIANTVYSGNISNSGGTVNVSNSFAGSGFKITGSPGVLNLDSTFWSASAGGMSINPLLLGLPTLSLSANPATGQIALNTAKNHQFNPATAAIYDFTVNGSTFVNGTLSAGQGSIGINNTNITAANTLSSYTTVPPTYNLVVQSGNQSSTPATPYVLLGYSLGTVNFNPGLYIDSSPFVGINIAKTSLVSTYTVAISGNTIFTNNVTVSGDITADFQASDKNLKENIIPITSALDKLLQIQGVNFNWKSDYKLNGVDVGVIAQDVEKVLPEAVKTRTDGYKGVDYEKLIPLLIEAVKELTNYVKSAK